MTEFRFIHAADLHIDSPLIGLARRSEGLAELIDNASRRSFDGLVSLAIEQQCSFVLVAGDLLDGEWRDYRTGLFLVDRMRRLRDVGVKVFIVLGNHDAENRYTKRLEFSDNVRVMSAKHAETAPLDDIGVAIHGQSFARRDVTENLALNYPKPLEGFFNIGLLHTACTGREGHERYAPCTTDDLIGRGYDYWALGHIHKREMLNEGPPILFPGNLQGRNAKESGPKGVTLVSVRENRVTGVEHRSLDTVRWLDERLDVAKCEDSDAVLAEVRALLERSVDAAEGRALALRLHICGTTPLHEDLVRRQVMLGQDIETEASAISSQIWMEKIVLETSLPRREATDPTVAGRLQSIMRESSGSEDFRKALAEVIAEIRGRVPHGVADEDFFANITERIPSRAARLASAIAAGGEE